MASTITHQSSQTLLLSDNTSIVLSIVQCQPTDRPIEDRFSVNISPAGDRIILGVYDGHGGTATSEYISKTLPPMLLGSPPHKHARIFENLDKSMIKAFTDDHSNNFLKSKSLEWEKHANVVKSGSTALLLDINLSTLVCTFSNAGDCRAICAGPLVSKGADEKHVVIFQETEDLNAKSNTERVRLQREHPNEDQVIVGDRLFGKIMSTRGFGDAYFKLPSDGLLGNRQHKKYIDVFSSLESSNKVPMNEQYASYFYGYKTPPYITASPEMGTFPLAADVMVVMASDGLWDLVSSKTVFFIVREAVNNGVQPERLAGTLLRKILETEKPGDDITIIVLKL